jgi:hypothetical protein
VSERYIAVDSVCAWPILTHLPDGTVVATLFNQPTHGGWEGDVECWASRDEGRTWQLRGVPAPHEPTTNRMNVAAGLTHSGDFVVLAAGWSKRNPPGHYSDLHDGEVLPTWVCRSTDGGQTWTQSDGVEPQPAEAERLIPYGDIIQLPDGELGVCIYTWATPDVRDNHFYTSADDGRTWTRRAPIRLGNTNETAPVALRSGRLLAAARTFCDQHLELLTSADQGRTWAPLGPVTLGCQHPAHFLQLHDDRVLLTYGIRNKGLYGLGARISRDEGKTWEPPRVLVDFQTAGDGGYPGSVQFEDGTILTAYYANRTPGHQRYHMGVIRWRTDE